MASEVYSAIIPMRTFVHGHDLGTAYYGLVIELDDQALAVLLLEELHHGDCD